MSSTLCTWLKRNHASVFDIEQDGDRKLTTEEIETLEGCRLLQSMLADLDLSLHTMRSFEAYENDLPTKVIPMIHDTFEELDEESSYGVANILCGSWSSS